LIRIPLPAQAVAAILLGDVFLPEGSQALDVGWDRGRGRAALADARWRAVVGESASAGACWWPPGMWSRSRVSRRSLGARWRVSYQDLQRSDGQSFPALIRFAEPGRDFDDGVEIKVRDRILNPSSRLTPSCSRRRPAICRKSRGRS
jgi:hypothetical protein